MLAAVRCNIYDLSEERLRIGILALALLERASSVSGRAAA